MNDIVAERSLYVISPEGEGKALVLRVGVPTKREDDWACSVSLGVLDSQLYTIYGIDSWQAVQQALLFASRRVGHFVEDGWKLYWEKNGEAATPNDLLEWKHPL
ncbi:hypothetical protein EGT07_02175 [Herbaspirillum sp. HC18]|nr:hypothetical protein EGT07_02175 [Herbaspirillum sp. HC18]